MTQPRRGVAVLASELHRDDGVAASLLLPRRCSSPASAAHAPPPLHSLLAVDCTAHTSSRRSTASPRRRPMVRSAFRLQARAAGTQAQDRLRIGRRGKKPKSEFCLSADPLASRSSPQRRAARAHRAGRNSSAEAGITMHVEARWREHAGYFITTARARLERGSGALTPGEHGPTARAVVDPSPQERRAAVILGSPWAQEAQRRAMGLN